MVVQEFEIGTMLAERRDPAQGALLRAWLETRVLPDFAGRIFQVDLAVTRRGAALHVPIPRPVRDAIIAATSLVHGLTVVTRNKADFESTGVRILNPGISHHEASGTQRRIRTGPQSLILRSANASGTAASERSISTQDAST